MKSATPASRAPGPVSSEGLETRDGAFDEGGFFRMEELMVCACDWRGIVRRVWKPRIVASDGPSGHAVMRSTSFGPDAQLRVRGDVAW
jgi:hypothetical protein